MINYIEIKLNHAWRELEQNVRSSVLPTNEETLIKYGSTYYLKSRMNMFYPKSMTVLLPNNKDGSKTQNQGWINYLISRT